MKGYIKISTVADGAIAVETKLESVGEIDKAILLDSFMQGLRMSGKDVMMCLMLRSVGAFDTETHELSFDMDTLEQMKNLINRQDEEETAD